MPGANGRSASGYSRRRVLALAATGTAASAFLASCGAKRPGSTSSKPAASQPKSGGTLTVRYASDPANWDITYTGRDASSGAGISLAYDSLLSLKYGPDVDYGDVILQPGLAERWETPDSLAYTFHLRPSAKFADLPPVNGRAFTAADAKWSVEYHSRTGAFAGKSLAPSQSAWVFDEIDKVETPDASTVAVHFKQPFAPFLNYSGSFWSSMLAHDIYDADGDFKKQMVGTGAWQWDKADSQTGSQWVWKKNTSYWDTGKPYLDEIRWIYVPDDATAVAAFQTGQLDILDGPALGVTSQTVQQLNKSMPQAVVFDYINPNPLHVYLSVKKPPLSDLRIRKAVSLATDRDEFIKVFASGKGGWALAGADSATYTQQEIKGMVQYDPAQAQQLVREAGYPNGVDLEVIYPGNQTGDQRVQELQLLQAQWKKGGINLTLKSLDKNDWLAREKSGDFTVFVVTHTIDLDVDSYLYGTFYPTSPSNFAGIDDPTLSQLILSQRREPDPAKRKAIIQSAVKRINTDQYWALAVYYGVGYGVWHPYLKNYRPNRGAQAWPLRNSWLAK